MPDDKYRRETPPTEKEWGDIWRSVDLAEKMWIVVKPFHAVVTNWKALLGVVLFVSYINRDEISAALAVLTGGL